jgi:hypothetical protein
MIKNSLAAFGQAARALFRRRGALLVLAALYFAALWCAYQFFSTGVATGWQLGISAVTALVVPLLFFILQAGVVHYAVGDASAGVLIKRALRDCWKVLLLTLPLVALGVGLYYLLDWLHARLAAPAAAVPPPIIVRGARPSSVGWQDWLISTLRLLAFGAALPLLALHLWVELARRGLKATVKGIHRSAGRAFAPRSVLVYAVGALFFGVLPYFVIFTLPPLTSGWTELTIFGLRLALAFALTLCGWVVTTAALAAVAPNADYAAPPAEVIATEPHPTARPEAPPAPAQPAN